MLRASPRKILPLLIGAIATLAALVGGLVASGLFPSTGSRRDPAPLAQPGSRATADAAATLRSDGPDVCAVCGVVEAVRPYEARTDGAARSAFRVTVRMEDGSYRTLSQTARPAVVAGDRVRIADGTVVPATPRSAP